MKNRLYYYVPGLTSMDRNKLADHGFSHLKGCGSAFRSTAAGPDKTQGVVFIPRASGDDMTDAMPGYWPDRQEWHCCDGGRYWVGWMKDGRPGPDDLRKPVIRARVEKLELADGREWEFSAVAVLPLAFGLTPSGEFGGYRQPQNEHYYAAAEWLFQWGASARDELHEEIIQRLAVMLGMNYWLGYWECLALRLFTADNFIEASWAALGILETLRKKKAELLTSFEKSDSEDGPEDMHQDTGLTGTTCTDTGV